MENKQAAARWRSKSFLLRLLASYVLIPLIPPVFLVALSGTMTRFWASDWLAYILLYGGFAFAAMLVLGTPLLLCFLRLGWTGFLPFMAAGGLCAFITSCAVVRFLHTPFDPFTLTGVIAGLFYRILLFGFRPNEIGMVRLEELTIIQAPVERCFDLARSVEVHLQGNIHFGEHALATAGVTSGLIGLGQRVTWRAKHFGVWQNLTSQITIMDSPAYFQDIMLRGAFRSMKHDHYFRSLSPGSTEMKDVFCFAAPLPVLGTLAEVLVLRRYMRKLLHESNVVIKQIAESPEWQRYLSGPDCDTDDNAK